MEGVDADGSGLIVPWRNLNPYSIGILHHFTINIINIRHLMISSNILNIIKPKFVDAFFS